MLACVACIAWLSSCGGTATDTGRTGAGAHDAGAPAKCQLNSDCPSNLVCTFGLCHAECVSGSDCPGNQRCVASVPGDAGPTAGVCQLMHESVCHYDSDCAPPLVCAPDLQCRNACLADRDCLIGQRCLSGACAEA